MAIIEKAKRKVRRIVVSKARGARLYPYLYPAYWHRKMNRPGGSLDTLYFTARPNPGAGIGHQMANWIAGYWFAEQFRLRFAHSPFPSSQWENFLGFGRGEISVRELMKCGYSVRRLPLFMEDNDSDLQRIRNIISSYAGKRMVFLAEQDQFYRNQFGVMDTLREKFFTAPARQDDQLIFTPDSFNIAVHVRRGDIMRQPHRDNPNLRIRYQSNAYFVSALQTVLSYESNHRNIHIYLFSQGKPEDFAEFNAFSNVHFCLDMNAQDSFLHMVYADALITSKSSFSYKPALLNKGLKFCPVDFWHGYPHAEDWIILDSNGRPTQSQGEG